MRKTMSKPKEDTTYDECGGKDTEVHCGLVRMSYNDVMNK